MSTTRKRIDTVHHLDSLVEFHGAVHVTSGGAALIARNALYHADVIARKCPWTVVSLVNSG